MAVLGAVTSAWLLAPSTGPDATSPTGPQPAPVAVVAPAPAPEVPAAAPVARDDVDEVVRAPVDDEEAFQQRFETFQADVQRAADCDALLDRHVEPLLRIEEALLSERFQGPDNLQRRMSLLGTYDTQLSELLARGECP